MYELRFGCVDSYVISLCRLLVDVSELPASLIELISAVAP